MRTSRSGNMAAKAAALRRKSPASRTLCSVTVKIKRKFMEKTSKKAWGKLLKNQKTKHIFDFFLFQTCNLSGFMLK